MRKNKILPSSKNSVEAYHKSAPIALVLAFFLFVAGMLLRDSLLCSVPLCGLGILFVLCGLIWRNTEYFTQSELLMSENFKALYRRYKEAQGYEEKIRACDALLAYIPQMDEKVVTEILKAECPMKKKPYFHPEVGYLQEGYLSGLVISSRRGRAEAEKRRAEAEESLNREKARAEYLLKKQNAYTDALNSIPIAPIVIDSTTKRLELHRISEIPEIKYSKITKKFNKDKLTSFIIVDTETTGLKTQGGRILELSAILYENFQPVAAWSTLINPQKAIPAEATRINHITDDMVADAPTLPQVSASFLDFVGLTSLVGYNLPFDLKFLFARGIDLVSQKRKFYDVLELARRAYKGELDSFSLSNVADFCNIYPGSVHRSLADCYTTGLIFSDCIDSILEN